MVTRIKKFTSMRNITNYLSIILLLFGAVLWPFWVIKGYLYEWYPLIGSFVAIYGGLIANIFYIIKNRK
jgi:hypothetical protein